MPHRFKRFIFVFSVIIFMTTGLSVAAVKIPVVAKVGTVDITFFEVKREMHRILPMNTSYHGGITPEKTKEVSLKALNKLLDQAYKVQWAWDNGLTVSDAALEKRLEGVRSQFKTPEELQTALGEEDIDDFHASIQRMLLAKKAEDIAVNSKVEFSAADTEAFYEKNTFMYQLPKQYRASHILIKVDPSLVGEDREKLIARANDLAEQAKSGEDFYNLAYYNSDDDTKFVGGDIGIFHSGQAAKEVEDAIKDLSPGDIVGPVETIAGFHIIKLTEVQEPRLMPYEEVQDKIKKTVEEKQRKVLYEEWMASLKNQYTSEIIHPDLQ